MYGHRIMCPGTEGDDFCHRAGDDQLPRDFCHRHRAVAAMKWVARRSHARRSPKQARGGFQRAALYRHLGGDPGVRLGVRPLPGERRHPNRNKAVLTDGQTEVGMPNDMKEETPVAALVKELMLGERT